MRLRFAVLASLLTALVAVVVPAVVSAAPKHNHGLTINVTPNPILAGEGVLIYGQLNGANSAGKTIVLYHHVAGSHQGYVAIGHTTTDSHGFYEVTREEGVVVTNRSWFTREAGVPGVHSRTVYERVAALVSLSANKTTSDTHHPILFSGHVAPNHAGERVLLQEQDGLTGDEWRTIDSGRLGPDSNYLISYRWNRPGVHDVRVVFPGDNRNVRGESDTVTVTIEQTQVAGFTINASPSDIIPEGSSVTISGILDQPGTTTRELNTSVTLWGHGDGQPYHAIVSVATGADGSYSFNQTPPNNEVYQVRTTFPPNRSTAQLFEGVRDVVTLMSSSTTSTVGGQVMLSGNVTPDKAGHVIFLQRLGADGDWHDVGVTLVDSSSNYKFTWTFGTPGSKEFRVRIPGGPENVGAASTPVTITVALPPVASLPPAS